MPRGRKAKGNSTTNSTANGTSKENPTPDIVIKSTTVVSPDKVIVDLITRKAFIIPRQIFVIAKAGDFLRVATIDDMKNIETPQSMPEKTYEEKSFDFYRYHRAVFDASSHADAKRKLEKISEDKTKLLKAYGKGIKVVEEEF